MFSSELYISPRRCDTFINYYSMPRYYIYITFRLTFESVVCDTKTIRYPKMSRLYSLSASITHCDARNGGIKFK